MTVAEAEAMFSMAVQIVLTSSAERFVVRLSGWKTMQPSAFWAVAVPRQVKQDSRKMFNAFFIMVSLPRRRCGLQYRLH
jgi:hypothetical protein